jgi:nicotinamide-nucleotide amidase
MSDGHADDDIAALVAELAMRLRARGERLTAAESCTGGWIAKCCTDRGGSSDWFERGFVTYSNAAKTEMLGVPEDRIETHGAVSAAVVRSMAVGALAHSRADWALAVSGVAGPDGGTPDKPVGTVWFAWAAAGGEPQAECRHLPGDREAVRRASVGVALAGLLDRLQI